MEKRDLYYYKRGDNCIVYCLDYYLGMPKAKMNEALKSKIIAMLEDGEVSEVCRIDGKYVYKKK